LSPILDMYDSSIISYDISTSPSLEQTKRMLNEAFKQYPNLEGLIFHSDQGWQYQHQYYINELKKAIEEYIKYYNEKKNQCKKKRIESISL
jgi:putative transposase